MRGAGNIWKDEAFRLVAQPIGAQRLHNLSSLASAVTVNSSIAAALFGAPHIGCRAAGAQASSELEVWHLAVDHRKNMPEEKRLGRGNAGC